MPHITFRLDEPTIERIETLRSEHKLSRSAQLKELLTLGLESKAGGPTPLQAEMTRLRLQLEILQTHVGESAANHQRELQATRRLSEAQLDLLSKLGIESVMIVRALALIHGRQLLTDAQKAARDYYASQIELPPNTAQENGEERRAF